MLYMMKRFIVFMMIFLGLTIPSFAQVIVSGTIVDSKNRPVPGIRIEIVEGNESGYSDVDGAFNINVSESPSKVRIIYPGLKPFVRNYVPRMVIKINHDLESLSNSKLVNLDELVVTAPLKIDVDLMALNVTPVDAG